MALDFPSSPATNDTYSIGNKTWQYDGAGWRLLSVAAGDDTNVTFNDNGAFAGSNGFTFDVSTNNVTVANTLTTTKLITTTLQANGTVGTAGQALTSNGSAVYWSTISSGLTAGNGLTSNTTHYAVQANAGLIANSTGLFVLANNGIVANSTGTFVDATYIGTLSANNSTYLNGQLAGYYTNASNITTGTLPYAQLGANVANTTGAFTFSGVHTHSANVVFNTTAGISANGSFGTSGQVLTSNATTVYWSTPTTGTVTNVATGNGLTGGPITSTGTVSVNANNGITANSTGLFVAAANGISVTSGGVNVLANTGIVSNTSGVFVAGAVSGVTTLAAGNTTITGFANVTSTIQGGAGLTIAGAASGITTLAAGNTTITGFANVTSTIQGGAGLTIAGAASGITTLAAGNTTITGFANVTSTIQGGAGLTIAGALSGVTTAAVGNTTITGFANVSSTLQVAGVSTFNGNVVLGTVGLSSNGSFGSTGQVLTTNGSSTYWSTVTSGLSAGNGLTSNATHYAVLANNGIVANSTGVFAKAANGISVTGDGINVVANTGIVSNTSGVFVAGAVSGVTTLAAGNTTITGFANVSGNTIVSGNVGIGNTSPATKLHVTGNYGLGVTTIASTNNINVNCISGNYFVATANGSAANITFSSVPATNTAYGFVLVLTNGGSNTITWSSSPKWQSGLAPTLTASGTDVLVFITNDNGTTWRGSVSMLDTK